MTATAKRTRGTRTNVVGKSRAGRTQTFSVSVDAQTKKILKTEAKRRHGGNMSALITALASELRRREAIDWLLEGVPTPPRDELDALLAEIDREPRRARTKRSSA